MEWNEQTIHQLVENQRAYFQSGATMDVTWRKKQLKKLKAVLIKYRSELEQALAADLGRCPTEAYFCDIGSTLLEINETLRGMKRWARPEWHLSGLCAFPSVSTRVYKMPYGVSLIISPFNYPILLSLGVLTAALAGGNTAILKASSKSPACTALLKKMLQETFPDEYVCLVDGGHEVADFCLAERVDKIFYTGSPQVGRHVLESAADKLIPVALELGGETGNWCVVRKDANLRDAARKIAFFKLCNAGQICIDINQVAVAEEVAEQFLSYLKAEFTRQVGGEPLSNEEYPHLINKDAWQRCVERVAPYKSRIVYGGKGDPESLRFEPTLLYPVSADEEIVQKELFSPVLPVVPFKDEEADALLRTIGEREHGLALYIFTKDIKWARRVMRTQQYGGGCINEVCVHLMVKGVPFNGTGHSGMGAYHGKWGFREFTHPATVLRGAGHLNLPLRVHPYSGWKNKYKLWLIRLFER